MDHEFCFTCAFFRVFCFPDFLTDVVCMCCLNSSMVVLEMLMSLNIPSSLEVN